MNGFGKADPEHRTPATNWDCMGPAVTSRRRPTGALISVFFRPAPDEKPRSGPAPRAEPRTRSAFPKPFLLPHAPPSTQRAPRPWSGSSSPSRLFALGRLMVGWPFLLEGSRTILEELLLPMVEDRGLQAEFLAERSGDAQHTAVRRPDSHKLSRTSGTDVYGP